MEAFYNWLPGGAQPGSVAAHARCWNEPADTWSQASKSSFDAATTGLKK